MTAAVDAGEPSCRLGDVDSAELTLTFALMLRSPAWMLLRRVMRMLPP
jgi:hypothetical protein